MTAHRSGRVLLPAPQSDALAALPVGGPTRPPLQRRGPETLRHAERSRDSLATRHSLTGFSVYAPTQAGHLREGHGAAAASSEAEAERSAQQALLTPGGQSLASREAIRPAVLHAEQAAAMESRFGAGEALGQELRGYFEPRFGVDFGSVRVHRGSAADAEARHHGARAFTFGHHVVLGNGAPDLTSREGRSLLAHELAHVQQQNGATPLVQRQEEEWSISPDPSEEEQLDALMAAVKQRIQTADAETLVRVHEIFEAEWRGREMAAMPEARGPNRALTKEALVSEGITGRMVEEAGEDLPRIFSAVMLSDLLICLGIYEDEKEAKSKIAEFPKKGVEAALEELYTSLPGLVTPPAAPPAFADLGTELTAVESFPFPLSIKPKVDLDIPAAPEARPHPLQPRLSVTKRVVRPGSEVAVKVTAEKSSWIYLLAAKDENATIQTTEDLLVAEPQIVSEEVRNREFFFAAPKQPGIYQVRLVSWEDDILARVTVIVMAKLKLGGPGHEPPLDPNLA